MIIHTHKTAKTIKKTLIAMGILLLLALIGGAIYVYITDRNAVVPAPTLVVEEKKPFENTPPPNPNNPESAAVQFISSPVVAGENASITVQTKATSDCDIVVAYKNVPSKDSGLKTKKADVHGSVTWTWTVESTAAPGKWPVKVTCKLFGKTGYVEGTLEVTK